jgi:hypothetical protein
VLTYIVVTLNNVAHPAKLHVVVVTLSDRFSSHASEVHEHRVVQVDVKLAVHFMLRHLAPRLEWERLKNI